MAARLLQDNQLLSDDERLDRAFTLALARSPLKAERDSLRKFLAAEKSHYQAQAADAEKLEHVGIAPLPAKIAPTDLAAWANVCRVILNLQETITRY
jgi:hypothetical protein